MGWYDRAIYAADRTTNKHNDTYRYVTPHKTNVVSHSYNAGIDPAWAYGLMRQESRFVTSARSHVGAGGLMQIMPDTAKLIARQMGETYNPAALSEMNTNIRYGTFYLSMIQGQLSNNPVLATAGYNAGIGQDVGNLITNRLRLINIQKPFHCLRPEIMSSMS